MQLLLFWFELCISGQTCPPNPNLPSISNAVMPQFWDRAYISDVVFLHFLILSFDAFSFDAFLCSLPPPPQALQPMEGSRIEKIQSCAKVSLKKRKYRTNVISPIILLKHAFMFQLWVREFLCWTYSIVGETIYISSISS